MRLNKLKDCHLDTCERLMRGHINEQQAIYLLTTQGLSGQESEFLLEIFASNIKAVTVIIRFFSFLILLGILFSGTLIFILWNK